MKKSDAELRALVDSCESRMMRTNWWMGTYRHKATGRRYVPERVVINEADLSPLVLYRTFGNVSQGEPIFFVRQLEEFLEKFEEVEG